MNKLGFFIKSKCTNSFLRNLSWKKKKKKNSQSKFYHTSMVQFLLLLPQKSELTNSKQFRCQPQSSIISTTDWQWRSPNIHKLSTPFFSRRDRVLYFISQYFISWPSHEVSSSSSSDSAGGTGNWLLCSTAQEFRRALILNSLHFWPEANQENKGKTSFELKRQKPTMKWCTRG